MAACLNAANEELVAAFLAGRAHFVDIPRHIEAVMTRHRNYPARTLEDLFEVDGWARAPGARADRTGACRTSLTWTPRTRSTPMRGMLPARAPPSHRQRASRCGGARAGLRLVCASRPVALRKLHRRLVADAACDAPAHARDLRVRAHCRRFCRRGARAGQARRMGARAGLRLRGHAASSGLCRAR